MNAESSSQRCARFRAALQGARLPCALVDLDAFDANVDTLVAPARAHEKGLRIATKSVRSPALLRAIATRAGATARGWMTYDALETRALASDGFDDFLLAYPTMQRADVAAIASIAHENKRICVIVDDAVQLDSLDAAARHAETIVDVAIDLDASYRPLGVLTHVGVRRSPIRDAASAVALHAAISARKHLRLTGVMAYEAQVAGLADDAGDALKSAALGALKSRSIVDVARRRAEVVAALRAHGATISIVNGGGTGSIHSSCADPSLTEVTAGSGFYCPHLFDGYRDVRLQPAAYFALQVVRAPASRMRTCHGGGLIASGAAGRDRLPVPTLPDGLTLLSLEGAGEVQTPLLLGEGVQLDVGDAVFFRHAKAGEPLEHFAEVLLVRGDRVVDRAKTYRGCGWSFLG
ncbi:MAG: alanine racemase [Polyangiales bacterium]